MILQPQIAFLFDKRSLARKKSVDVMLGSSRDHQIIKGVEGKLNGEELSLSRHQ